MIISKNYPFCPRKNLAPISAAAGATSQPTKTSQKGTAYLSLVCTLCQNDARLKLNYFINHIKRDLNLRAKFILQLAPPVRSDTLISSPSVSYFHFFFQRLRLRFNAL